MTTRAVRQLSLAGIAPRHMAISPDNEEVFVALGISGTEVVPFNAANANPLPVSAQTIIAVKNAGGSALSVAVDLRSRLFYIGETLGISASVNTGALRAFSYSSLSSILSEIAGSTYASGGLTPISILPPTSGTSVYVANAAKNGGNTGSITGFAVSANGSSYSLTQIPVALRLVLLRPVWRRTLRDLSCCWSTLAEIPILTFIRSMLRPPEN